jgi:malonyl-CoA O-methyltransferase
VKNLPKSIGKVLDLGCGSGRVYEELLNQNIEYSSFLGVDFSKDMLKLHRKNKNVELIEGDFNDKSIFFKINREFNTIVSSSALQWAKDLDFIFKNTSKLAPFGAFFLFGSNTFKSIHNIVDVKSPIHNIEYIKESFNSYYKADICEVYNFKLEFESTLDMLRYIKKSGVSGGGFGLSFREINKILKEYPHNYLEFETIFLCGIKK